MQKAVAVVLWLPRVIKLLNELYHAWQEIKASPTYARIVAEAQAAKTDSPFN